MPTRRGCLTYLTLGLTVATGALAARCSSDDPAPPSRLLDGSPAPRLPLELDGVTAAPVLTRVSVLLVGNVEPGSLSAACLRGIWDGVEHAESIVARTGVSGESVTFRDRSRRGLYACDHGAGPREDDRRWCGGAFGRLYAGRLRDPRLDVGGCRTRDEDPVAFVWVEPHRKAGSVAVEQPGYAEVYRVAGGLPVRIATTSDIDIEASRATFRLSEHDPEGRLLRRYQVEAVVSG